MDTISLMQQLLPHLQASQSSTPTSTSKFTSQFTQRSLMNSNPPFGFIKISPTTAVVDANTGLPTAAVAETPNLLGLMSATEAALPPEAASTSGGMPSASSTASHFVNYMAAVQAAAALQSDMLHSAFRTPFPTQPSPSSSSTTSESFLTLALNSFVSPSETSSDSSKCDNNSKSGSIDSCRTGLLCQVCSDTASGFHYGVFACEGCKGFFRRSIQQKISYRPCSKSQQCAIVRNNRNRCQYCRLKKCMVVGMSRDAVRFGRVPKREKVKMVEEMQKASARSLVDSMTFELEDEQALTTAIDWGFQEFGEIIKSEMNSEAVSKNCGISVSERMDYLLKNFSAIQNGGLDALLKNECPLKSVAYLPLTKAVVTFSESIRGFLLLFQNDRVRLLKNSIFQVLLLRLISLKSENSDYLYNTNIQRLSVESSSKLNADSIAEFARKFRSLNLDDRQTALFSALVMCQAEINCNSAASFELSQANLVKMLQDKLWFALQKTFIGYNAIDITILIQNLFSILNDLKKLHEQHEQKLKGVMYNGQLPGTGPCKSETSLIDGLPVLKKALETPVIKSEVSTTCPSNLSSSKSSNEDLSSIRERHPTVSFLLSAKPKTELSSEDEPLNLCVKDKPVASTP